MGEQLDDPYCAVEEGAKLMTRLLRTFKPLATRVLAAHDAAYDLLQKLEVRATRCQAAGQQLSTGWRCCEMCMRQMWIPVPLGC